MKRKTIIKLINFSTSKWIETGEEKYRTAFCALLDELKLHHTK